MEFLLALLALIGLTVLLLGLAVLGLGWLLNRSRQGSASGAIAQELLQRLDRLEARLERLEARQAPEAGIVSAGVRPPRVPSRPAGQPLRQKVMAPAPPLASPPAGAPPQNQAFAKRLEQSIENWTGRLGAAAMVAGVTFLLLHSAYRLEPAQRFLLTLLAAAALAGLSLWLARRPSWRELSDWIRSAAGAIALLACAAAGGLPGLGLQWIDQPLPALAILLLGIGLNLLLAWRSRRQALAAAHLVLSLVPLAIVPDRKSVV